MSSPSFQERIIGVAKQYLLEPVTDALFAGVLLLSIIHECFAVSLLQTVPLRVEDKQTCVWKKMSLMFCLSLSVVQGTDGLAPNSPMPSSNLFSDWSIVHGAAIGLI